MNDDDFCRPPSDLLTVGAFFLVVCISLIISCTYEESTKVTISRKNPPAFRLSGSGHQRFFAVSEIPPENQVPASKQNPDRNIDLWEISPEAGTPDLAREWPEITYGKVKYQNNRAETSHQPTRLRERVMRRFKSPDHAQRFLSAFGIIMSHFPSGSPPCAAGVNRQMMKTRFAAWQLVVGAQTAN